MQTYDTYWQKIFAKRLSEAADRESEVILSDGIEDFAAYKYRVGIIRGINIAHEMIELVNDEIRKAEQGSK